ncbi:MAG: dipeptidase [Balneolaceae bacterium]|nr:dipeptidase [Balneolaceae bacterium]
MLVLLFVANCAQSDLEKKARDIHERVITLDTHVDINTANFTADRNYTMDLPIQVTLPKMEEGGLDVAWLIVYTGQDTLSEEGYAAAYENAMDKFNAIHRLTKEIAPDRIELATTSEDVRRIAASGKKVAMIGIENAYPVGTDLGRIKEFYDLGARYMSLSHNGHSQFCDSNTGERDDVWLYNGLSELGKEAIKEMNKWGMMIDLSHPSYESNMQTMDLTRAPVIASHSSARALDPSVSRNLSDEELIKLAETGGVVQTVAFRSYLDSEKHAAYQEAADEIINQVMEEEGFERKSWGEVRQMPKDERDAYIAKYREIQAMAQPRVEAEVEAPPVAVSDLVDHIDYMVELIGIDHVGISSDFDGGGGVHQWMDASETFNVTLELVKRGYSESEIEQLWSGNLLRVLDEVTAIAAQIQAEG